MHHFLRLVPPEWGNKDLSESSSSSRSPCSKVFPIAKSSGTSGRYPKQWHLPQWRRLLQRPDVDFIEIETCVPSAWGHRVRRASSIGAGRASPFLIILHFVRLCSASVRGFRRRTSMWRSRAADRGSLFPDAPEQESMHPTSCGPWWRLWSILWWGGGQNHSRSSQKLVDDNPMGGTAGSSCTRRSMGAGHGGGPPQSTTTSWQTRRGGALLWENPGRRYGPH